MAQQLIVLTAPPALGIEINTQNPHGNLQPPVTPTPKT